MAPTNNLFFFAGMAQIFTLTALSIQRCMIVWMPTIGMIDDSKFSIITVWMLSASIAIPPLFGWSEYVPESSGLR
jgi:hypothetical protein